MTEANVTEAFKLHMLVNLKDHFSQESQYVVKL